MTEFKKKNQAELEDLAGATNKLTLSQGFGIFWTPSDDPIIDGQIDAGTMTAGTYGSFIVGDASMGKQLNGNIIPYKGKEEVAEGDALAFYLGTASRDFTDSEGVVQIEKGAQKVILLPA